MCKKEEFPSTPFFFFFKWHNKEIAEKEKQGQKEELSYSWEINVDWTKNQKWC